MSAYRTIDAYIRAQTPVASERLTVIRSIFKDLIPDCEEAIRYGMPSFTVGDTHLYIGAYEDHIGMYPMYGIPALNEAMRPYRGKGTKDALHFKYIKPLPIKLIREIILAKSVTTP